MKTRNLDLLQSFKNFEKKSGCKKFASIWMPVETSASGFFLQPGLILLGF